MGKSRKQKSSKPRNAAKAKKVVKPAYGEVLYDEDGYRVGDDGYPMTSCRRRMHRLLDIVLVFGYLCIVAAVVLVVWALFQGQSYTAGDFIAFGGNEYRGHSVASLMRGESLVVFIIGLLCIFVNRRGFAWLYDQGNGGAVRIMLAGLAVLAAGWAIYLFSSVALPDPGSLAYLVLAALLFATMRDVERERRTLRPSVVSKRKAG